MKIFVDIDDTICYYEGDDKKNLDYNKAKPYESRIQKVNKLFDEGHVIIYWTARGTKTGIRWFHVTQKQLNDWGAKYHELRMGKPNYDLFIDDKNINSENYFSLV